MTKLIVVQGEPIATVVFEPKVHRGDVVLVHGFTGSKEDFSDLQEKIEIALENNKWKEIGALAQKDYYENHTPTECYKKYKNNVIEVLGKI